MSQWSWSRSSVALDFAGHARPALAVAAAMAMAGCFDSRPAELSTSPSPASLVESAGSVSLNSPAVDLTSAESADRSGSEVAWIGVLVAPRKLELSAPANGHVVQVATTEDQEVKVGQLLFRLESQEVNAQLASERSNLELARTSQQEAELLHQQALAVERRYEAMEGLVSRVEVEAAVLTSQQAAIAMKAASVRLKQAEVEVERLESALGALNVRSPVRGIVLRRRVQAGESVTAQQSLLTLVDADSWRARFAVPAEDVARLELGQSVLIRSEAGTELGGRLVRIPRLRDVATGLYFVEADLESPLEVAVHAEAVLVELASSRS